MAVKVYCELYDKKGVYYSFIGDITNSLFFSNTTQAIQNNKEYNSFVMEIVEYVKNKEINYGKKTKAIYVCFVNEKNEIICITIVTKIKQKGNILKYKFNTIDILDKGIVIKSKTNETEM